MSGGSLEYASHKLELLEELILEELDEINPPQDVLNEILRWKNKLRPLSKAIHLIEWYLSGDIGREEFLKEIKEV